MDRNVDWDKQVLDEELLPEFVGQRVQFAAIQYIFGIDPAWKRNPVSGIGEPPPLFVQPAYEPQRRRILIGPFGSKITMQFGDLAIVVPGQCPDLDIVFGFNLVADNGDRVVFIRSHLYIDGRIGGELIVMISIGTGKREADR